MSKEEMFFDEKDRNPLKWIIITSVILVLVALVSYLYYNLKPKVILVNTINEVKKSFVSEDSVNLKFRIDYDVYTDDDRVNKVLEYLSKFKLDADVRSNLSDNLEYSMYFNYDDKETYKVGCYLYKDNIYVGVLDKLYLIDNGKEYVSGIKDILSNDNTSISDIFDSLINIDEKYISREFNKDGLVISITLNDEVYKNYSFDYKPSKIVITYKIKDFKLSISSVNIIDEECNINILFNGKSFTFDFVKDEKTLLKIVVDDLGNKEKRIVVQYDKVNLLFSAVVKIEDNTTSDNIDYSSAANLSEISSEDIEKLMNTLLNSEAFSDLSDTINKYMGGIEE